MEVILQLGGSSRSRAPTSQISVVPILFLFFFISSHHSGVMMPVSWGERDMSRHGDLCLPSCRNPCLHGDALLSVLRDRHSVDGFRDMQQKSIVVVDHTKRHIRYRDRILFRFLFCAPNKSYIHYFSLITLSHIVIFLFLFLYHIFPLPADDLLYDLIQQNYHSFAKD